MDPRFLRAMCLPVVLVLGAFVAAGEHESLSGSGSGLDLASKEAPVTRQPPQGPPSVLYALGEGSAYVEGCFGEGRIACLCPLMMASVFEGQFGLTAAPSEDPDFQAFTVSGLELSVGLSDEQLTITGGGEYRVGTAEGEPVQEMILDLSFDGGPAVVFDSGLVAVPDGVEFPMIDVAVNMNDHQCYDIEISVQAEPGD